MLEALLTPDPETPRRRLGGLILLGGLVLALGAAFWGILDRREADAALAKTTEAAALPSVATVVAQAGPAEQEIVLPGTVQAEYDTPIYARTSGYLKRWYTDIGAKVKAGDLLAEIDSPEIDQQLSQAKADLQTAEANNKVAQATARRVHALLPSAAVSAARSMTRWLASWRIVSSSRVLRCANSKRRLPPSPASGMRLAAPAAPTRCCWC